jgi:hypothetical protein
MKLQQQTVGLAESKVYPNELIYPSISICVQSSLDEFPVKPVRKPWMLLKDTLNNRLKRLEYTVNKTTGLRFVCVTHVTAWMREFSFILHYLNCISLQTLLLLAQWSISGQRKVV